MSFSDDEEILQDFLVEVGEILELLSEQLVELEQRPDDIDLLNAIFRGFHTVKGGAGFLQFEPMVELCHVTENIFDALRTGKRQVTTHLTDVVLKVLDAISLQYDQISKSHAPESADPHIVTALAKLVRGEEHVEGELNGPVVAGDVKPNAIKSETEAFEEDDFEALLDELHGKGKAPTAARKLNGDNAQQEKNSQDIEKEKITQKPSQITIPEQNNNDLTDREFEDLLDELHGAGKAPGAKVQSSSSSALESSDTITEDEFENLLDRLHGVGASPKGGKLPRGNDEQSEVPSSLVSEKKSEVSSSQAKSKPVEVVQSSGKDNSTSKTRHSKNTLASPSKDEVVEVRKTTVAAKSIETPTEDKEHKSTKPSKGSKGPNKGKKSAEKKETKRGGNEVTVRVDTQRLDDIMNMVGELVLARNRLVMLGSKRNDDELNAALGLLDVVTGDLQTEVMKTRMQPIRKVFGRFPRVVRDLARSLNKEISLELKGEDTDLDKNLVEALADPLIHLVRNAADHGIETPEERLRVGKSRVGTVILDARQEGDHILLSIHDDGAGMDPDLLRNKAVEKHLMDADTAARLTDKEAFDLIFFPGFSTKTDVSDVSGRGVGMDVVKTKITQLNGLLDIESTLGEGTCLTIKVPLTLAIMPALMILLEQQAFALPLVSVNEIFQMDLTRTHVVDSQECVMIRDKPVPIFHLKRWLVRKPNEISDLSFCHVVIVSVGNTRVGFVVDDLIGQEEVVIKPLGKMLQGTPGMAGATITGDGSIALILDVPGMLKQYAGTA